MSKYNKETLELYLKYAQESATSAFYRKDNEHYDKMLLVCNVIKRELYELHSPPPEGFREYVNSVVGYSYGDAGFHRFREVLVDDRAILRR